jgi:hypothetical protein
MKSDLDSVVDRLDNVRVDLFASMSENELKPNEALTFLTSVLVQVFSEFADDNSREHFNAIMSQCYDAYTLIKAEPEGGIQ